MIGLAEFGKEIAEISKKVFSLDEIPLQVGEAWELADIPDEVGEEVITTADKLEQSSSSEKEQEDESEEKDSNYKNLTEERKELESKDGIVREVHHIPADSTTDLSYNDGPAIIMEKTDHRQTASCGSSKEARDYQAKQKELISEGKFREAVEMDIDDIREKFGDKYDSEIEKLEKYIDKLESEGKI